MNAPPIAPHLKRRFLMIAFHPYGSDVCGLLGMAPASLDVDEVERQTAMTPWRELMGWGTGAGSIHQSRITTPDVFTFAYLYEAAAASLIGAEHPQYNRSLGEDLVSFFIAVVALGEDQQ